MYFLQRMDKEKNVWEIKQTSVWQEIDDEACKKIKDGLEWGHWRLVKVIDDKTTVIFEKKGKEPKKPREPKKKQVFVVIRHNDRESGFDARYVLEDAFYDKKKAEKWVKDLNDYNEGRLAYETYWVSPVKLRGLPKTKTKAEKELLDIFKDTVFALQLETLGRGASCQEGVVAKCGCSKCVLQRCEAMLAKIKNKGAK